MIPVKEIEVTNKEKFASQIRAIARYNNLNLIDAITSFCEDEEIMIEDVIPLLDRNLKEEIRVTAVGLNYVRGEKVTTLF